MRLPSRFHPNLAYELPRNKMRMVPGSRHHAVSMSAYHFGEFVGFGCRWKELLSVPQLAFLEL